MRNEEIFAKRLKNARKMKGYSQQELANCTNNKISKYMICKYEKAKVLPNSDIILLFSRILDQPIDYFLRPFIFTANDIKFRKKSKLLKTKESAIIENVVDLVERYIEIEDICNIKREDFNKYPKKIMDKSDIKKAVCDLRNEWQIGLDGIVSTIDLLERNGIKILEIDCVESFDGLSFIVNKNFPVLILNKNFPSERKRFTVLHEFGHLFLDFSNVDIKQEEKFCNLFANEMLIPEDVFKKLLGSNRVDIPYKELKNIQINYGISCDALMYKAKDVGIIPEYKYKNYCYKKNINTEFKNTFETSLYPNESSDRFERLVYEALSKELISFSKASVLLKRNIYDICNDLIIV